MSKIESLEELSEMDTFTIDDVQELVDYLETATNVANDELTEYRDTYGEEIGAESEEHTHQLGLLEEACSAAEAALAEAKAVLDDMGRRDYAISEDYFAEYIEELIKDCYIPREVDLGRWPFNHLDMDAAAEEAKQDYYDVEVCGKTFYVS